MFTAWIGLYLANKRFNKKSVHTSYTEQCELQIIQLPTSYNKYEKRFKILLLLRQGSSLYF
jgi:hypothetical protein